MPSQPPPLPTSLTVSSPWWASPPADPPPAARFNWSAIVASLSISLTLIVCVAAWIVTHPNKPAPTPESPSLAIHAPPAQTTNEPPAPPAAPSSAAVETKPAFHRIQHPETIVANIPKIEEEPPPPPLPPPSAEPKQETEPAPAAPAQPAAPAAPAGPAGETYGTQVLFLNNPAAARDEARRDHKLLFVMHISGNFEDSCFT